MTKKAYVLLFLFVLLFTQCSKRNDPAPQKNTIVMKFANGYTREQSFKIKMSGSRDPSWSIGTEYMPTNDHYSFGIELPNGGGGEITFDSTGYGRDGIYMGFSNGTDTWNAVSGTVYIEDSGRVMDLGPRTMKVTFTNVVFTAKSLTGIMRTCIASGNLIDTEVF